MKQMGKKSHFRKKKNYRNSEEGLRKSHKPTTAANGNVTNGAFRRRTPIKMGHIFASIS